MGGFEALVHKSVRHDELAIANHRTFIVAHIVGPMLAAMAVPLHWYVYGEFDSVVLFSLCWLMTPVFVALFLWRTGALTIAYLLSAAILAILVGFVASHTAGLSSFALFWLLAVPIEAAMSGSRRVVLSSIILCIAVLAVLGGLSELDALPPSRVSAANAPLYATIGLLSALLYIGMLAGTIDHLYGKTSRAAQNSEERFRLLAENATDVITRHGPNGEVSFVSGAWEQLVDGDAGDLSGTGYLNLVHPEDRHAYLTAFVRAADTVAPATCEFRIASELPRPGRSPAYKWVELNCRPISKSGKDGGTCELVAISRDITVRRRHQEALREARDTAQEANTAKTVFLANISHELRTPLNSVIGFAELMERELPVANGAARFEEYASLIRESGEHLLGVVNDLLDLSKIEAGQFSVCSEPLDLNEIAGYCSQAMKSSAKDADVAIAIDLAIEDIDILADPRACKQILLNLLSNAVKFSEPGCVVKIATRYSDTHALLSVEDQGPGIAPEIIDRLGQPFVQADADYSRSHDGTGLGLSIVNGLVKLHQGLIDIDSRKNIGTTVTIAFPLPGLSDHHLPDEQKAKEQDSRILEPTA